jgi:hypothetical protein
MMTPSDIIAAFGRAGSNRAAPDSSVGWGRPDVAVAASFPYGILVTNPSDSVLSSVTPLISWTVPESPPFAQPLSYRLRVATDTVFATEIVDTTLSGTAVQLTQVLKPGDRLVLELTATTVDGFSLTVPPDTQYVAPDWANLTAYNDPKGFAIRERRPTFSWTSPGVITPPGPFTYDITVFRVDNRFPALEASGLEETQYTATKDLDLNTPYKWQVVARLGADSAITESEGTFVVVDESIPTATLLFQNFPNPFPDRSSGLTATCIWFDLAETGNVRLDILDIRGHVVRNLVPGTAFDSELEAGRYGRGESGLPGSCDPRLQWDGTDSSGRHVPRGIYLVRFATEVGTFLKRIVYMGPGF